MATQPKIRYDIEARATGRSEIEDLARQLRQLDDAFDPATAARADELGRELRELGAQQGAVENFQRLQDQTRQARDRAAEALAAFKALRTEIASGDAPTRAQTGQLQKLGEAVGRTQAQATASAKALGQARQELATYGIASTNAKGTQEQLGAAIDGVRQKVAALGKDASAQRTYVELAKATDQARTAFEAADKAVDVYRASLAGLGEPTLAETLKLQRLGAAARDASRQFQQASQAQQAAGAALRAQGIDTDRLVASQTRLRTTLTATAGAARQVADAFTAQGRAAQQADQANRTTATGLQQVAGQLRTVQGLAGAALGGGLAGGLVGDVVSTADAFNLLAARVRLVTGEGPAFTAAMEGVQRIATGTGTSLSSVGDLFSRLAAATQELGVGQEQALQLTETITQAIQLSGGSAQAADAAITQLVQGLQSGVLRGEEFNSVVEQSPRLAQALADGLGVARSELRGLAQDGRLGAAEVIRALTSQRQAIEAEFGQLPLTVGRSLENLKTQWSLFVSSLDQGTGATTAIADGINALAQNLDTVAQVAAIAGSAVVASLAVKGVQSLRAYAVEAAAAAGATNLLKASLDKVPATLNIVVTAVGLEVGLEIGRILYENSEAARKLGVGIVAFFELILNDLRLVKEAAAAIFTDDTVDQALDRYVQRNKEIGDSMRVLWQEAEQSPDVVRAAADAAAASTERMGTAASAAGTTIATAGATGAAGLQQVRQAASETEQAIAALAASAGVKLPASAQSVSALTQAMVQAASSSTELAQRIGAELPGAIAKLSGPELQQFRTSFIQALTESGDKAGLLQSVLVATGKQAAQSLGVDVAAAGQTLSKEFTAAQDNLSILVQTLPALSAAGVEVGTVLEQALDAMLEKAKNDTELKALEQRILALGEAGLVSKPKVEQLFDGIKKKSEEAKVGVNSLSEAMKVFGLQTKDDAQKVAKNFGDAWKLIRDDATSSLATKRAAFAQYAEAAIAANGGVVTSEIKLQAEILKLKIDVDDTGKAIVRSMEDGAKATDRLGEGFRRVKSEVNQTAGALSNFNGLFDKFKKSSLTYDSDGFATGKNGQRIGIEQQVDIPEGGYFDEAAFRREADFAARAGGTPPDPQRFVRSGDGMNGGEANANPWAAWLARNGGTRQSLTPAPAPVPAPAPAREQGSQASSASAANASAQATRRVEVTINVGRERATGLFPADDADRLLRALEDAQRSSGIGPSYQ